MACAFAGATLSIVPTARSARTEAPRRATLVRNRRAFFSAGVGMGRVYGPAGSLHYRIIARRIAALRRPPQATAA
jgi:hypothetical protein